MAVKRAVLGVAVFVAAILLIAYLAVLLLVNSASLQDWLRAELKDRTGYELASGDWRLDPLLRLTLSAVAVSKASKPVLQAERIVVGLSPASLFGKTIHRLQLVKPTLHLDVGELFDSTKTNKLDVSIRHLNIVDGTLVLEIGNGNPVDFRSLTMNAENVNLGPTTGLNLRADVPSLEGTIDIAVTVDEKEKKGKIRLEQNRTQGFAKLIKGNRNTSSLEANVELTNKAGEPLQLRADGKVNGMTIGAERFSGDFAFQADLASDLKSAVVGAKLVTTELPSRPQFLPVTLPAGNATLTLEGNYKLAEKQLAIKSLQLTSPLGTAAASGSIDFTPPITLANTRVNLRKVPFGNLRPVLPAALKSLAIVGQIEADLELRGPLRALDIRGITRSSGMQLKGDGFSVAELDLKTPVIWTGASFHAGDIQLRGRKLVAQWKNRMDISAEEIRFDGSMDKKRDEPAKMAGGVRISHGRFASADGSKVGEDLGLGGHFETSGGYNTSGISLTGKLEIEQGEVLWGKFFGDLKSQRPGLEFDGDYVIDKNLVRLRHATLALASIGHIAVKGEIEHSAETPLMRLEIQSDDLQTAGAFEFFIRETLNRTYPIVDRLAVDGRIGLFVKATGALYEPILEGELRLRRGEIRGKANNWQLGGVELLLPFRVRYPAAPSEGAPANMPTGTLTIESARFGTEIVRAITVPLSLWNNSLQFHQTIRMPIYGGSLEISRVYWKDIIEAPQAVSLSLDAQSLQLLRLTEALGWYHFGGTVSASIPKIEWTEESLRSQGQMEVDVFGGRVQIGQLEIQNPFSPVPSIKLEARFQDIQLEQASETFAFGRISGILAGTVSDLVIANMQPSQFSADIHSVEKAGFSQRISVEALNKITVLSSGNDAGALYSGIAGFFDNFRYSKLGFRATLKNDKLILRGVESRDDQEYLVVGSLIPPTVNVISHTQEIAFSELLRRLQRIQKSEAAREAVR
ncbi:MAG: hypothetical protein ACM3TN_20725 [Alphaproteobacteria bacterium]